MRLFLLSSLLATAAVVQSQLVMPAPGTYNIQNVGTGTFLNLKGGVNGGDEDTPLIGYHNDSGTAMQWVYQIASEEQGLFTMQNVAVPRFARAPKHTSGSAVVGGKSNEVWQLVQVESGKFRIQAVGGSESFVFSLPGSNDEAPVTLIAPSADSNEVWSFRPLTGN